MFGFKNLSREVAIEAGWDLLKWIISNLWWVVGMGALAAAVVGWLTKQPLIVVFGMIAIALVAVSASLYFAVRAINAFQDRKKSSQTARSETGERPQQSDVAIGNVVTFYENRSKLPHLNDALQGARTVWVAWHSGGYPTTQGIYSSAPIKRMILSDPNYIRSFMAADRIFGVKIDDAIKEIKRSTGKAKEAGVEVRWFKGPTTSLILANPESQDGWARVEIFYPFAEPHERSSIRFNQDEYPELFTTFVEVYEKMWKDENSREPRAAVDY